MTYHLPPEELKQAAEKYAKAESDCAPCPEQEYEHAFTDFTSGCDHTMQTISPTLDKALEALTEAHCEIHDVRPIYKRTSGNYERLTAKLAKITEAINEIKKLKG